VTNNLKPAEWYSPAQAVVFLKGEVNEATLKQYCRLGKIKSKQVGPKKRWMIAGSAIQELKKSWELEWIASFTSPIQNAWKKKRGAWMALVRKMKKNAVMMRKINAKRRSQVEKVTAHVALLSDPEDKARFNKEFVRLRRKSSQLMEDFRKGEQLTQKDFAIRINTRG
jgi:hypothetical protein